MVDKKTGLKPKAKTSKAKETTKASTKVTQVNSKAVPEVPVPVAEKAEVVEQPEIEAKITKAGKHSAKSIKEAEQKQAKEAKKAAKSVDEAKPKVPVKPPRSRTERAGKKYREAAKLIDAGKLYIPNEAMELIVKTSATKFDSTVELHVNLAVDPKQADQNIRGTIVLPSGTGKSLKVAVLADGDDAEKAKAAGADKVGDAVLLAELDKESIDFDVLITTPAMMPKLAKHARLLGPKGLMPNPKSGTVTPDISKAVSEAKAGRLEYRVDSAGIVHLAIGKVSFGEQKLQDNFDTVMTSIRSAKPSSVKGIFLKSAYLTTTMGPSIKLEV